MFNSILAQLCKNKSRNGRNEGARCNWACGGSRLKLIRGRRRRLATGRHKRNVVDGHVARPWKPHFCFYYHLKVFLIYKYSQVLDKSCNLKQQTLWYCSLDIWILPSFHLSPWLPLIDQIFLYSPLGLVNDSWDVYN